MKRIRWMGASKDALSAFPSDAKQAAGFQLYLLQQGQSPDDFKSLPQVGNGACEIRVQIGEDFRVIYVAKWNDAIYVLHAFQKKSAKTPQGDLDLAKKRYKEAKAASDAAKKAKG
jgi:phage-related protein